MNFSLRPVDPVKDAPLLHSWVTLDYARFWGMSDATPGDVEREYRTLNASATHHAFLGYDDDVPAFLVERYLPAHSPLAAVYNVQPNDVGMHFLVAPVSTPVAGYTTAVLTFIMEYLLSDPAVRRVVVEPDVRNLKVHALNARVGFAAARTISLPDKDALLSFCTREQFLHAFEEYLP